MPTFTFDHTGQRATRSRKIMHDFFEEVNANRVAGTPRVPPCGEYLTVGYEEYECTRVRGHCGEHVAWGEQWDEWYDEEIDDYIEEPNAYIAFAWLTQEDI